MVIPVQSDESIYTPVIGTFDTRPISGTPNTLEVFDSEGWVATLTEGARTVTVRGPERVFTEQKRLFSDPFVRTVTNGWGMSPGGGSWSNVNGADSLYSVSGGTARVLLDAANLSRHVTARDNDVVDVDVQVTTTLDKQPVTAGASSAISFAYQDVNNHYRARLLFSSLNGNVQLALEKEAAGALTTLGTATTIGTGWIANEEWHIRVRHTGSTLRCRAWKAGTTEPTAWTHTATDSTFKAGRVGIRAIASTGNAALPLNALYRNFTLHAGRWANPPVVRHDRWVRLLDVPYKGQWSFDVAAKIRAWLSDRTPDALAYSWMFITGAPNVFDPLLSGKRIFGQSNYGPLASDGTRYEGADWHDFIGTSWTYPNGETRSHPFGNITVNGCMDCSGYLRMVFGRCMGIPMVRNNDFDGINLPRTTRNMDPYGPGAIVADNVGAPPATLTALRPGDVVFFDADQSEPTEGQIDHTGIYIGTDAQGAMRFVSSRKTANGPTFGDLGGPSTLNGGSTYASRLRRVRRF